MHNQQLTLSQIQTNAYILDEEAGREIVLSAPSLQLEHRHGKTNQHKDHSDSPNLMER